MMRGRADFDNLAERAILSLVLAFPVLLLSVRNGMSVCFVLLLLISLLYLFRFGWKNIIDWRPEDVSFAIAMASLVGATLISQAYHRSFRLDALDGASRFLFAIPIYLMLRNVASSIPRVLEYGLPLGALAGLLTNTFFPSIYWQGEGTYFVDPAMFGSAMLVLAFLSVSSINWTRRDSLSLLMLKLAGFVVGIYCAIQTRERGVWITIPILLILWAHYRFPFRHRAAIAAAAIVVALAGYWLNPKIQDRIVLTQAEIANMLGGNFDTSVGSRLQIWNATVEVIRQNPIVGIGPAAVSDQLRELSRGGWLTATGLQAGLSQIHNEILAETVRFGLFGLFSILALYFIPMLLFARATASADSVKRIAGVMGVLFVTGYFMIGLTIETFNIKMFATFYAVMVATLLAIARRTALEPAATAATNAVRLVA